MSMYKYSFFNDYSEGAHPNILKALSDSNLEQQSGYGLDKYTIEAKDTIKKLCNPNAEVFFVSGGTQVNMLTLAHMMQSYESVISAHTGHINVHEAGAIESTGHKVESIMVTNGKLNPALILPLIEEHKDEHMTKPKVVFISNATEVGTVYTKDELIELYNFCKAQDLYLYLDGARLGSALTSEGNNITFEDLGKYTDAFYIGGTKNGALLGEALVINNDEVKKEFFRNIKQKGALLAKGRVLGIQFLELMSNNLYLEMAKYSNMLAMKLTNGIKALGYTFLSDSKTNQIFPIFPNDLITKLSELYGFYTWSKVDNEKSSIRLVTCWATREEMVDEFLNDLKQLTK